MVVVMVVLTMKFTLTKISKLLQNTLLQYPHNWPSMHLFSKQFSKEYYLGYSGVAMNSKLKNPHHKNYVNWGYWHWILLRLTKLTNDRNTTLVRQNGNGNLRSRKMVFKKSTRPVRISDTAQNYTCCIIIFYLWDLAHHTLISLLWLHKVKCKTSKTR